MFEIQGKYARAMLTIDNLDTEAIQQLYNLLNAHSSSGSYVAIMPDGHKGKDCLVGFTQHFENEEDVKLVPNIIGADISCGIFAWPLGKFTPDASVLNRLDAFIKENIPHGKGSVSSGRKYLTEEDVAYFTEEETLLEQEEKRWRSNVRTRDAVADQLCSLGSENHFISLERSATTETTYLIIHTGSRGFGRRICELYQYAAKCNHPHGCPSGLEYLLPSDDGYSGYLHFMEAAIRFSERNKELIAHAILEFLKIEEQPGRISTDHNYYDGQERTVRKGAVSAHKGETFLCPINMRDGTLICRGKGNADWNYSAPHGAGRLLSRSEAKKILNLAEVKKTLGDLFTTTIDHSLDEAPDAYKDADFIKAHIAPTADVVDHLHPIYNFKG